jgi:protein AIR1/2
MSDPEIIDLANSPILAAASGSQSLPAKPLSVDPEVGEKTPKKKPRKRKRKQKTDTQSQDTTTANTRNNSEEETGEEEGHSPAARQVRRKRESGSSTKENDPSTSALQDRTSSSKKQKHKENALSFGHIATGNANPGDLFFEDITPGPLPSNIGNLPPPAFGITDLPSQNTDDTKLLLPAHVSVLGSTPVEILPPTESDEEGETDYIKYLDYDGDRRNVSSGQVLSRCPQVLNLPRHRNSCDILKSPKMNP